MTLKNRSGSYKLNQLLFAYTHISLVRIRQLVQTNLTYKECHANINVDVNGIRTKIYLFPLLRAKGTKRTCQHMSHSAEYILRHVQSCICRWSGPNYRISVENQQISFNTPLGSTRNSRYCLCHENRAHMNWHMSS